VSGQRLSKLVVVMLAGVFMASVGYCAGQKGRPEPVLLVVMDPLAKELACACVKGYGQRDYRKVAARLEKALTQRVSVEFSDDLAETLEREKPAREVIVVGDQSLVAHGAKKAGLKCHPVCELSDKEGNTTLAGLFVARSDDSVKELKDVGGRKVLFGLAEADEKFGASLAALRNAGVEVPEKPERRGSYSDAALDMLDSSMSPPPVAVIPGYALPLLEGCGSVKPGSLRVIGKTKPVPFITVFVGDNVGAEKEEKILRSLEGIKGDGKLLKAMETRDGFRALKSLKPSAANGWPDWRGPNRDGHVARLPARLPATAKYLWKKPAMTGSLAGLSTSGERLILAERDLGDEYDVYRCLNTNNGELVWRIEFPARGKLDYGQSPRATPVIQEDRVYLLGAFGGLRCVSLSRGKVLWDRQLPKEFKAALPTWGMCSTPLIVDDMLIVNPGGTNASLAALDCKTGRTRWTTPGWPAAYAAFIYGEFGGQHQIVGYDQHSLGGWDATTGKRLWRVVPRAEGDFNVPTPIAANGNIIVSTENNGTREYRFDESGANAPKVAGECAALAPTTMSPVLTCGRLFGADHGLYCLDVGNGLKPIWRNEDEAPGDHATLLADDERVLVITIGGELILLDGKADTCAIISRLKIFEDDVELYSHPALVGTRLYARGGASVVCMDLGMK
jgi:outer membrane protein assembly factor BamB